MVTYRRNATSVTFQNVNIPRVITHYETIKEVFGKQYRYADRKVVQLYMKMFRLGKLGRDSWKALFNILKKPRYTLVLLCLIPKTIFRSKKNDSKRVQYSLK